MPKDGWEGGSGKSQLFKLNYIHGVFHLKKIQKNKLF